MHGDWIQAKAARSLHPAQVETALVQLSENWAATAPALVDLVENFPLGEAAILHVLAMSQICAMRLAQHPEIFLWLCQSEISSAGRGYGQMRRDLHDFTEESIAANNFRGLRLWKGREMTRIALRELADTASLEETTAELSELAEICLTEVYEHWDSDLRRRYGSPETEFTILALGKLGGYELNHSSDVDLMFLYGDEGQLSRLSYHEWFNRLGEKILETFTSANAEGSLFRVDLRLRPEGSAGPLTRSLTSMENYYAGFGETWERLALIKSRGICGSRELTYEFLRQLQPFIYPKTPTPDLLDEVAAIKRRIERDVVGHENLGWNVKLGAGGIREIEFVIQTLQFIHGARHAFLQETSTLKALRFLGELDLLPNTEVLALDRAYRFLRRVEHRLQIDAEQQTHTVPQDEAVLRRLALSLGYSSGQEFIDLLREQMRNVREIFGRVISQTPAESAPIDLSIFHDEKRAAKALADLSQAGGSFHRGARTRQLFRKLRPLLFSRLATAADPDATLNQFVRFVEAYGLRSLLFEMLVTHSRLLELLVRTFDASQFAGDVLIRRPQLLEDITRGPAFGRSISVEEHLQRLTALEAASLDSVRAYHQRQLLRILLQDVLALVDLPGLLADLSALAEACLRYANSLVGSEELTIIALGKFGGREITYGADLDVLFVGDNIRAAQKLTSAMAQPSAEGNLPALDARLRPDGEKGSLVHSLAAYEFYYEQRAQLWEIHALTRVRAIIGPLQNQFIEMAQRFWKKAGERADLFQQIDNMFERIRRDRGSGSDFADLKTGLGGIIQAEFLVHALQMNNGIWAPNWNDTLAQLRERGIISAVEAAEVKQAYELLRLCESGLRRWENKSVSTLPGDPAELLRFASRIGCEDVENFRQKYLQARDTIGSTYKKYVKAGRG